MKTISNLNLMLLSLIVATLTLGQSCTSESGEKEGEGKEKTVKPAAHQHDSENKKNHDPGKNKLVQLNNGEKWEANKATTDGIKKMKEIIKEGSLEIEVQHEKLMTAFNTIFEKCTMKGEAHNQLHNYLLPLKKQLESLKECKDTNSCKKVTTTIENHLNHYSEFFK